jgi:hypothetical protein
MPSAQDVQLRDEALTSLERMQSFDSATLVREADLGTRKNFAAAVERANRLIELHKRVTPRALDDFPADKLNQIKVRANHDYSLFDQILKFDPDQPTSARDQLVSQLEGAYNQSFEALHPLISYSLHRSADFQRLDAEARAAVQGVRDQAEGITKELEKSRTEAQRVLDGIREAAAEVGVTQEAKYFREAAEYHATEAQNWKILTYKLAASLGGYAILSLFLHKWEILAPRNTYDAVQLTVSKALLFAVLSFVLYLAARNFLSHQHNAIVNRHRQNALLTYKTIADAAGDSPNRDVILTHAAACVYSPQPTGYSSDGAGSGPGVKSVVEMLTRPMSTSTS